MIREIVESAENTYIINFPKELVGKKVEVIAFEIEEEKQNLLPPLDETQESRLQDIKERYAKYPRTSHDNYKFDRNEANNFD